jgi:hypothetical protein
MRAAFVVHGSCSSTVMPSTPLSSKLEDLVLALVGKQPAGFAFSSGLTASMMALCESHSMTAGDLCRYDRGQG